MLYVKRNDFKSIKEVVEYNTGMSAEEFTVDVRDGFIKNLDNAVKFAKEFLKTNSTSKITIVGDYDCDGIMATGIMAIAFRLYGVEVETRLPKRFSEGYGLSEKIIDEIDEGLIITVDNGIAAVKAIEKAKKKGLSVIIIDHHLPLSYTIDGNKKIILPDADVIVDPAAEDESDFSNYCGAALAYHFARKLLPDMKLKNLLVLVSIATVADVMPLVGPNRTMVKDGLKYINQGVSVPGLKALLENIELTNVQESDYGFKLGPLFNAPSRMYDNGADKALALISSDYDNPRIKHRAAFLVKTNELRKETVKEIMKKLKNLNLEDERPLVLYDNSINEGIIGIIAGKYCESNEAPVIVFTDSKENEIKGSGRSPENVHLRETLDKVNEKHPDIFARYGGHAGAAGLSIYKDKLDDFKIAFKEAVGELPFKSDKVYYDLEADESDSFEKIVAFQNEFAPYGQGNPMPVFHMTLDLKSGSYVRAKDSDSFSIMDKFETIKVIGYGLADKYEKIGRPLRLEMVGSFRESWFKGNRSIVFELKDFMAI